MEKYVEGGKSPGALIFWCKQSVNSGGLGWSDQQVKVEVGGTIRVEIHKSFLTGGRYQGGEVIEINPAKDELLDDETLAITESKGPVLD